MPSDESGTAQSRRDVLRGLAATGASAIGASAVAGATDGDLNDVTERGTADLRTGDLDRTVTVRTDGTASYSFDVTGVVDPADAPATALEGDGVSATISEGTHRFSFSGEFTTFDVEGAAEVRVDGEPFDVDAFPRRTLTITPFGSVDVDVSASGAVEVERGDLDQPNPRTASGTVRRRVTLSFAGELTYADLDGYARVHKDGDLVSEEELLPSALPGELTVSGPGDEVSVEVSGAVDTDAYYATAADGTVRAVSRGDGVTGRYEGRVETVEHESGATAEIVPESKHVVCTAPTDRRVEFTTGSTEAFIYDDEVHQEPTVTVAPGETERIKYFGDVTRISVDDVDVTFDHERYEDAAASARLQMAAEFERTDAYERLAANAAADIRHDADGIYAVSVDRGDDPVDVVLHKFTDLERGDEGALSLTRARTDGAVRDAKNMYQWRTESGQYDRMRKDVLRLGGGVGVAAATLETETYEFDLPEVPTTEQVRTQGDWLPTVPWGDWIGDIMDGLENVADGIAGVSADYLASAIEYADVDAEEITVTGGKILCNSIVGIQDLATKFIDDGKIKALWKTRLYGYSSLISLVGTGVFEEIGNENYDCAACIALIRLSLDVGVCGAGVAAFCGTTAMATLGLTGVPCQLLLGAVCSAVISVLPDARDICSGHTAPTEVDVC